MLLILSLIVSATLGANAFAGACAPYTMIEKSAAPAAREAQSFLWKVQKPGGSESYLIGTFHTTQVLNNWEALSLVFPSLKNFVTETDFSAQSAREFAALSVDGKSDLVAALGPDLYAQAQALATEAGIDLSASHLKAWAAFLALARPPHESSASLDSFLQSQARGQGLKTIALQSATAMVASIETLSPDEQTEILKETVCNYAAVQKQVQNLEHLYVHDDVAGFLTESERLSSPVAGLTEKLNSSLVSERNREFLPKLLQALDQPSMVAVGAAHLYGEGGLMALLRKNGFEVTPLERARFMKELLLKANSETPHTLDPLISWLHANSALAQDYREPELQVVPSTEMRNHGCDETCAFARGAKTIYVSEMIWRDLKSGEPNLQASLLAILIRDAQEAAAGGETRCSYWQKKNIESLLLRTRYLSSRGVPAIGLPMLPIGNCTGD